MKHFDQRELDKNGQHQPFGISALKIWPRLLDKGSPSCSYYYTKSSTNASHSRPMGHAQPLAHPPILITIHASQNSPLYPSDPHRITI